MINIISINDSFEFTAGFYMGIGKVCYVQGDLDSALEYYNAAFWWCGDIYEASEMYKLSYVYIELERAYLSNGNYIKAIECFRKYIELLDWVCNDTDPKLIRAYNDLRRYYDAIGNTDESLSIYNKVKALCKKAYGDEHAYVSFPANSHWEV